MRLSRIACIAAAVLASAAAPAMAVTLTVGTGTSNNSAPFSGVFTGSAGTNYQQVYAASNFGSAPIAITGLSFLYDPAIGTQTPAGGTFTLSLSTTSKPVNGLSFNYASNIGANNTQIFSGTLAGQSTATSLDFNFTPFIYNPTEGNLLLDVLASNVTNGSSAFKANSGDANGTFSRVTNFAFAGSANYGLQTVFTFDGAAVTPTAVPEPASWAMLIGGFGLAGGVLRQRRRAVIAFA